MATTVQKPIDPRDESGWPQPLTWGPPVVRRSRSVDAVGSNELFQTSSAPSWLEPTRIETNETPGVIMPRVISAVGELGGEVLCVKPHKSKVKCSIFKDFCHILFHVTLHRAAPAQQASAAYILEFQKRQGDGFVWDTVYSSLVDSLVDLLVHEPHSRDQRGAPCGSSPRATLLDGIVPSELGALAAEVATVPTLEAQAMAARAYGLAAATMQARMLAGKDAEDSGGRGAQSASVLRIEESLLALRKVKDPEVECCVQSALDIVGSLDESLRSVQRKLPAQSEGGSGHYPWEPSEPHVKGGLSMRHFERWSCPHDPSMGVMLSSSA